MIAHSIIVDEIPTFYQDPPVGVSAVNSPAMPRYSCSVIRGVHGSPNSWGVLVYDSKWIGRFVGLSLFVTGLSPTVHALALPSWHRSHRSAASSRSTRGWRPGGWAER